MATKQSASGGEADVHAASADPGGNLSSTASCDISFHDACADAPASEVRNGDADTAAKISCERRVRGSTPTHALQSEKIPPQGSSICRRIFSETRGFSALCGTRTSREVDLLCTIV